MANDAVAGGELAENWEEHARTDPLWAILSEEEKRGHGWDIEEFFNTGAVAVDATLERLARYVDDPPRGTAVDFGCGVGRLTQGFAEYFERVIGVDVSPTMIALANELNFNRERAEFLLNQSSTLAALPHDSVDLINSQITLQHIAPDATRGYLLEFLRVLRPGGVLVFNLPSGERPEGDKRLEPQPMPAEAYRASIRVIDPPTTMAPSTSTLLRAVVRNDSPVAWDRGELTSGAVEDWWSANGTRRQSEIGGVDLGNHWLSEEGILLVNDDGRSELPRRLGPGEEAEIELPIFSPPQMGSYLCQVDLVHEWVAWFANHGSPVAEFTIDVAASASPRTWVSRLIGTGNASPAGWTGLAAAVLQRRKERAPHPDRGLGEQWAAIVDRLPAAEGTPEPYGMFAIPEAEVTALIGSNGGELIGIEEDHSSGWDWVSRTYFVRKRAS